MCLKKKLTKELKDNNKGITLIELVIVLGLMGLILSLIGTMFLASMPARKMVEHQVQSYSNGRWTFMNIERQIKKSEEIVIKDGVVFIQDMETPRYYVYYNLVNDRIMKYKVNKDTLRPISQGGTSQFSENISDFEIKYLKENMLYLKIVADVDGQKLNLESNIRTGVNIIYR